MELLWSLCAIAIIVGVIAMFIGHDGFYGFVGVAVGVVILGFGFFISWGLFANSRPDNYVRTDTELISTEEIASMHFTMNRNGDVVLEFTERNVYGAAEIHDIDATRVVVVVDSDETPRIETWRNENGDWYVVNDGSTRYRIYLPVKPPLDIDLPITIK